jgi:protein disulfide-isomerase
MKRFFLYACLIICLLSLACAQKSSDTKLTQSTEESGIWTEDFSIAIQRASDTQRAILINFTGSDWCGWCVRLDDEVFTKDSFIEFAYENLVLFKADFPRNITQTDELKAQNTRLAEKYGVRGFPTILLIDKDENQIARTGYVEGGAENYITHIQELLAP